MNSEIIQPFLRSMPYCSWFKKAKEVSHDYSWAYVNLPTKIKKQLIEFGKEIDPDDLYIKEAEEGLEKDSHITVKYAILTNEFKDVKELLKGESGGKFYLGESSIFETDKYDVVKIDVKSDDLKRLHEKLNNLPHEDKYPEYHAHATIAYLKKGMGKKYVGKFKIDKLFTFDELFFGDQDKKDHKIKLAFNNWYKLSQSWYTEEIAKNTKDPKLLVEILKRGENDLVSAYAAFNPNCLPEILVEILRRRKDDLVSGYAAFNPNCPPEILVEILRREKDDDVSRCAARNPNCPVKEKIEWMRATGKIGIEDPSKHIIEYDNKEEKEDEDLKKLRDLVSFNLKEYRYAQVLNIEIGKGVEDKIAALYELEYKYSMVRDRFKGSPERKVGVLNNLRSQLNEVLEDVKTILISVFGEWLQKHALLSAATWAKGRTKEFDIDEVAAEETYQGMVGEYIRYAVYGGEDHFPTDKNAYDRFFMEMVNKAKMNLEQFPVFSRVLESRLDDYKEMLTNELYDQGFKEFGENMGKRFRNQDQAENYIERLTVKNVDLDSLFYIEGISRFVGIVENLGLAVKVLEEFYKNFVFHPWVQYWAAMGIEDTRENVEKVYSQLQQISSNNIRNALLVINLAIHTTHQTGGMLDYISEYAGGSGSSSEMKSFLNEMSAGKKAEEWNKELREIGVEI